MNDPNFFHIKNKLEESGHFRDVEYTEKSKKELLRKVYFQEVVSKFFVFFATVFLLYAFLYSSQWLPFSFLENNLVYLLLLVIVFIVAVWLSVRMDEWLGSFKWKSSIQVATSSLVILFFLFQLFTPYFYPEQYLKNQAVEKIETYFELYDLGKSKREELIDEIFVEQMAFTMKNLNVSLPDTETLELEVLDSNRNFDRYELSVKVERRLEADVITDVYHFNFNWERGDFKINGYVMGNEELE